MTQTLISLIRQLRPHQYGQFGEYLFASLCIQRGSTVLAQHDGRVDFIVDGVPVDVKTIIKHIDHANSELRPFYRGARVAGVTYCTVGFLSDGAVVTMPDGSEIMLPWSRIEGTWSEYRRNKLVLPKSSHRISKKELIAPILRRIATACEDADVRFRFLYRTCQANFGSESPHNLKPPTTEPNRITVYVEFANHVVSVENIGRIIAFPDATSASLPMRVKKNLGKPKVDLNRISQRYVFTELDEFEAAVKQLAYEAHSHL